MSTDKNRGLLRLIAFFKLVKSFFLVAGGFSVLSMARPGELAAS